MKFVVCIWLLVGLTGCVTSVKYDLSRHESGTLLDIEVIDSRDNVVSKTTYRYATFVIGERHVIPGPVEIVSMKLDKYLSNITKSKIESIELTDFQLIISDPKHAARLVGAAVAGGSYAAGILVESGLSSNAGRDGVISKVQLKVDQKLFSCVNFVEAYDEIGALVGPRVSGKELTLPMNKVIDRCMKSMANEINHNYLKV